MRRGIAGLGCALFLLPPPAALAAKKAVAPPAPRSARLARIVEIEDTREGDVTEIGGLLRDPDRGVRRRAALAAGRLARPELVPPLLDQLADREPEVRRMAAFAVGLIGLAEPARPAETRAQSPTAGSAGREPARPGAARAAVRPEPARTPDAVDRLIAALGDPERGVRAAAAEALGRLGDARAAAPLAQFVVARLPATISTMAVRGDDPSDPDDSWSEQRAALFALAALGDRRAARQALLADKRPRFDWWAATWTAARLADPALRPLLLQALSSDDPRSRALGARGLAALKDVSVLERLLPLLRDADETVAVAALRAVAALGDARGTAAAASLLVSPSDTVRREALVALAALPADPALRPRLVALVADRSPWVRGAAFGALARTSPEDFTLVLSGLDLDPDFRVRSELARALGAAGDETSLGVLRSMLQDQDPRVLPAVLEALRRSGVEDALELLQAHLQHEDLGVRAAAAAQIAALGPHGKGAALVAAWQRGLRDGGDIEARLAAVQALAAQRDEESRAGLSRVAAEDPARPVRLQAVLALRAVGAEAPQPASEKVIRPPLDYRETAAVFEPRPAIPVFTPRAFLHTAKGRIEIQLDVVDTPLTSASFVALARRGFYDGLAFHRVEPGFVVQGGCPRGDGSGGPGYTLRCELSRRPCGRGSVGMALSGRDTGGSQFFFTLAPQPQLDGRYTLFAKVVAGMEVVERLRPGDVIERVDVWTGD